MDVRIRIRFGRMKSSLGFSSHEPGLVWHDYVGIWRRVYGCTSLMEPATPMGQITAERAPGTDHPTLDFNKTT